MELQLEAIVSEITKELPVEVFNPNDWYLAGGVIYSLWNGTEPRDYDLFCKNKKAANKLRKYFRKNKELCDFTTKNAISKGKYQFVIRNIGEPEVEVNKFDFKHNCFYFDSGKLINCTEWEHLDNTELIFNTERGRDLLNIMTRIPKFLDRGMTITQAEMLSILEQATRPTKIFNERKTIKRRIIDKNELS